MKKISLSLVAALLMSQAVSAQAPQAINYQAAMRNASGAPMSSATVPVRFTIHDLTASGTVLFQETNTATTNAQGIMNITIGSGTAVTGTLSGINWGSGAKFLEVEVDGGSGLVSIGNQQMVSVPYALAAGNVPWTISGTNIYNSNTGNVGINTNSPAAKLHVKGGSEIMRNEMTGKAWQSFYQKGIYIGYIGTWTDTLDLDFGTSGSGNDVNIVTGATPKLTVKNNGQVGIGTNAPSSMTKVQIDGMGTYSSASPYQTSLMVTGATGTSSSGVYAIGGWRGVFGRNRAVAAGYEATGVYGLVDSNSSYSIAIGTRGEATATGPTNYGIYGNATGGSSANYGIYGTCVTGASNYAAYFNNKIYATSASSSIKAFKIDHPLDPQNKYLYHSSVESNDMMNIYNGNVTTSATGDATVTLPNYFSALNKDFKYQLTCIGTFAQAIVAEEISGNTFRIKTDKPNVKVSWQVAGVRQDAAANLYRIENEVEKPANEKGFYLIPEAYGKGPEMNFAQPAFTPDNSRN